MNDKAEYYIMKGVISEMSPEDQAKVAEAEAAVLAMVKQSDAAKIGALMAVMKITSEVK